MAGRVTAEFAGRCSCYLGGYCKHAVAVLLHDKVLWPEFLQLDAALTEHLTGITDRIIREEVYKDVGDADEVEEPLRIGTTLG